jgi:hypothetical protein
MGVITHLLPSRTVLRVLGMRVGTALPRRCVELASICMMLEI